MATGMFSTKGMYALRAMADLASHEGWVSLGDVSKRQNISRKCLDCSNGTICPQMGSCSTVSVWRDLGRVTSSYLDSKTLADLVGPDGGSCGVTFSDK